MNELMTTYEWKNIPWRKLERVVFKLQKRIFQASQNGDARKVRRLQRLLINSKAAKLIAVRRVTQENQGKSTAGVDGKKSLTPRQRMTLVKELNLEDKAMSTRRVWIPKPGKTEKRPLGIPTIKERAKQCLVKLALEPDWEAHFEKNSFGFRPGRSCHDATQAIFNAIRYKQKFVLDADIASCFDKINHKKLLEKLHTSSQIRKQIRAWLKGGVIDKGRWFPTEEGTPQGGTISPLLANIALHGMEEVIKKEFPANKAGYLKGYQKSITQPIVIRYADDFLVLHEDIEFILRCKEILSKWLKEMGLEIKESKTRIAHTFNSIEGKAGFDFLGFSIRQYPAGKYQTGKHNGKPLGFKTLIKPSKTKVQNHLKEIRAIIKTHKSVSQKALVEHLNPVVRGFANYFSTVSSKEIFSTLDHEIFVKLKSWAQRRHPNKTGYWVSNRYWHTIGNNNWVFGYAKGEEIIRLQSYSSVPIKRHTKVKGKASPFDGDLIYWSTRLGKHPEMPLRKAKLLKRQKGKCLHCGLYFKDGDLLEIDHIHPKAKGGKDCYENWQLLHRHCHDEKTAWDGKRYA